MADTTTVDPAVSQAQSNGTASAAKPALKATNPGDASAGEVADDELSEVPKAKVGAGDEGKGGGEGGEYDFEEEQQAVEGEDDEYQVGAHHDDEDDEDDDGDYHDEDGEGDGEYQPEAPNGGAAASGKPNLTALLLGDPNAPEEDEDEYNDEDDDEDAEYNVDDDDEDEGDDYMEESTPITPTSKKRGIQEAREDDEDEVDDAEEEGASKKKVKS